MANTDNTKETFGYSSIEIGVNFDRRKITKEAEKLIIAMEAEIQKASKNLKMGLVFDDTNIKKAISEYAKLTDSITKAIEAEKLLGSKGKGGDLGIKLSSQLEIAKNKLLDINKVIKDNNKLTKILFNKQTSSPNISLNISSLKDVLSMPNNTLEQTKIKIQNIKDKIAELTAMATSIHKDSKILVVAKGHKFKIKYPKRLIYDKIVNVGLKVDNKGDAKSLRDKDSDVKVCAYILLHNPILVFFFLRVYMFYLKWRYDSEVFCAIIERGINPKEI